MREELLAAGYEDVKASIQEDLDAFVAEHGDVQFVREGGSTAASDTASTSAPLQAQLLQAVRLRNNSGSLLFTDEVVNK